MPQTFQLPLIGPVVQNVDEVLLSSFTKRIMDGYLVYIGDKVFLIKRPGFTQFVDLGTNSPIDGLFWWDELELLIAVSSGTVFKITKTGTVSNLGAGLQYGNRVSFAVTKKAGVDVLAMANGGRIYVSENGGLIVPIADTDAPVTVTHVAILDSFLIANKVGSEQFYFSEVLDYTDWKPLNFASAEVRPDNIEALYTSGRNLFLLGRRSIERWYFDGTRFRRYVGAEEESGIIAPNSTIHLNGTFIYLDDKRRVVTLSNSAINIISSPYDRIIQSFETVDDAYADLMVIGGQTFYVLAFPTENRTLVYNVRIDNWTEWGSWDSGSSEYNRFIGNSYAFSTIWGQHFVGDKGNNGLIHYFDPNVYQDNGQPIRTLLESGFVDYNNLLRKSSLRMRFRLKRGTLEVGAAETQVSVKFRNDDEAEFGNEILVDMGQAGDSNFFVDLTQLGVYRARQWQISSSTNTPFIMGNVEEFVEFLDD